MGRSPCCDENGLKKGPWTPEEDEKLVYYIQKHGHGSWRALPKLAGLNRCGKSCRLRWTNYLRPDIKRGKFSQDEEQTILNLHSILGNKWSAIATHLPGRTDNEIKNFWNTHLKKKIIQMGFDPMTHRPRTDFFATIPHLLALANLVEHRSWDSHTVRLQAEAIDDARLQCLHYLLNSAAAMATSSSTNSLSTMNTTELEPLSLLGSPEMGSFNQYQVNQIPEVQMPGPFFEQANINHETIQSFSFSEIGQRNHETTPGSPLLTQSSLPPLTDVSVPNPGYTSSTSSCGGSGSTPFAWPELLLDDAFPNDLFS